MATGFREMLAAKQEKAETLLCVGLDPIVERFPQWVHEASLNELHPLLGQLQGLPPLPLLWARRVIDTTAPFACAFKPQLAHWEALEDGYETLRVVIRYIHERHPGIPVLADCKRGDIARTQAQYRKAILGRLGADGMNFSPYMGIDTMASLVDPDNPGKALVGLCYTSNPEARMVQDRTLLDGRRVWEATAEDVLSWAIELGVKEDAGLVMAAAHQHPDGSGRVYSDHLTRCRGITGDILWYLIPGVGTQGGFVDQTVRSSFRGWGSIAVNSSSAIDFADDPAAVARQTRDQLNEAKEGIR